MKNKKKLVELEKQLKSLRKKDKDAKKKLLDKEKESQKRKADNKGKNKLRARLASQDKKSRELGDKYKKVLIKSTVCPYCSKAIGKEAHLDHIFPISKGGLSEPRNLVYVCSKCYLKKSDMTLTKFIKEYNLERDFIEKRLDNLDKDY